MHAFEIVMTAANRFALQLSYRSMHRTASCKIRFSLRKITSGAPISFSFFQTIVSVDHTTIEIVHITCRMTSTFKCHHWAKCWWNNWNNCQEHPLRTNTRVQALNESKTFAFRVFLFQYLLLESFLYCSLSFARSRFLKMCKLLQHQYASKQVPYLMKVMICDFIENFTFNDFIDFFLVFVRSLLVFLLILRRLHFYFCFVFSFKIFDNRIFFIFVNTSDNVSSKVNYLFKVRNRIFRSIDIRDGTPRRNQMCATGDASSM
jgi:hypothetical protein